ncbi:hypothetical protein KC963_02475 [Candidatus Saccharibacteria bacterium]|nr:hypothetical protein [Candidatus Saccharibacteria bacterium]
MGQKRNIDNTTPSEQVLIARGELSGYDKRLLTSLLGKFGLTTTYQSQEAFDRREARVEYLRAELERVNSILRGEEPAEEFRFTDITAPDQFVVREHIEDLRLTMGALVTQGFVGRTFNYLVDANGSDRTHDRIVDTTKPKVFGRPQMKLVPRDPRPPQGVVVRSREELGLPPYPRQLDQLGKSGFCAAFAVQAGSIVELARGIPDDQSPSPSSTLGKVQLVGQMLEQQFTETAK